MRALPIKSTSAMKVSVFVETQTLINKLRFPFALLSRVSIILGSLINKKNYKKYLQVRDPLCWVSVI